MRSAEGAYAPLVYGVAMGDASLGRDLQRAGYTRGLTATAGVTAAQQGYALAALRCSAGKSTTAKRLDA